MEQVSCHAAKKYRNGPAPHPLGPLVERTSSAHSARTRLSAGLVLAGAVVVLAVAARVTPDPLHLGPHQQLRLSTCVVPVVWGFPCPTCGMTTAFAFLLDGRPLASFQAHPGGFVMALATLLATLLTAEVLCSGRAWRVNWYRVSPVWIPVALAGPILGGWVYKLGTGILTGELPLAR